MDPNGAGVLFFLAVDSVLGVGRVGGSPRLMCRAEGLGTFHPSSSDARSYFTGEETGTQQRQVAGPTAGFAAGLGRGRAGRFLGGALFQLLEELD